MLTIHENQPQPNLLFLLLKTNKIYSLIEILILCSAALLDLVKKEVMSIFQDKKVDQFYFVIIQRPID